MTIYFKIAIVFVRPKRLVLLECTDKVPLIRKTMKDYDILAPCHSVLMINLKTDGQEDE